MKHLIKNFGPVNAVNDLSFSVGSGSFFALLGENGAGKSTTISCMTTILRADSGSIVINGRTVGKDDSSVKNDIGVVFQESSLDPSLSVRENLLIRGRFYKRLSPKQLRMRVDELADLMKMGEYIGRRYGRLSGGQRRRSDIARALIHSPSVLFLDEPTAGLDPHGREIVWDTVSSLRAAYGLTVILTTHYMEEVESADKVVVIDRGLKIAEGSATDIRTRYARKRAEFTVRDFADTIVIRDCVAPYARTVSVRGTQVVVDFENGADVVDLLGRFLPLLSDLEVSNGTMDEAFISLVDSEEGAA